MVFCWDSVGVVGTCWYSIGFVGICWYLLALLVFAETHLSLRMRPTIAEDVHGLKVFWVRKVFMPRWLERILDVRRPALSTLAVDKGRVVELAI